MRKPYMIQSGRINIIILALAGWYMTSIAACSKSSSAPDQPPGPLRLNSIAFDNVSPAQPYYNISGSALVKFSFTAPLDKSSVTTSFYFKDNTGAAVPYNATWSNNDSVVTIQPSTSLKPITQYDIGFSFALKSRAGASLQSKVDAPFWTALDSTDKFPRISDSALLTLIQQQTFKYFWDLANTTSGLARERASGDVVTTGGSGFGVMSILVGVQRNFITRAQALDRLTTIVNFLSDSTKVQRYHGAFSHWMNGTTGATIPFSQKDDGGDIVETSYLLQGLLCARQFFNSTTDAGEISLRTKINDIYNAVDWNWYRQGGQDILYWNWSPDYAWAVNVPVSGWNEALITYVLAASSPTNAIPNSVYINGWAHNGGIANGKTFYGIRLPLGPDNGGPLFFAHYSFLGIDPHGLSDPYADYWTQDTAHARINYLYSVANPKHYNGYSNSCWGLTASDEENGYSAHAPDNDDGVITPTAAVASLPYVPTESMNAIRFFYYTLGDKLWGAYGFKDAFNLTNIWFDNDYLAIDQGPEIVMIENYRSGLLWNLFMSCPEIKTGLKNLGFQGPGL
ncbi:MAG TPA: glucoamylase family protein [Puia sp.]|nr:glucoamylase family protein [Puia sp.]